MADISSNPAGSSNAEAGMATLLLRGGIMAVLLAVAMLSVLILVPDGNDYAKAARLKEDRLLSLPGSRIVLIGGSNLAYGIDSRRIEALTGCAAVNMGMNGYFGVRFMLEEAQAGLRRGDVAVVALEYDSFVKSVDGTGTDLLMVGKTAPRALQYMTARQLASAAMRIPFVVQSKVGRLADEAMQELHDAAVGDRPEEDGEFLPSMDQIESLAGFTPEGDLVSHLGIKWPWEREDGMDLLNLAVDPGLFPLIRQFSHRMKDRGVDVVFSYTPVMRQYYEKYESAILRIDAEARRELGGIASIPAVPAAFVYDESKFFDTVYHLGREGREHRSHLVASHVVSREPGSAQCRGPNH